MESLESIETALALDWSPNALYHLTETLIVVLSTPGIPKRHLSAIWRISRILKSKLSAETKTIIFEAFQKATNNFRLQLKLYIRLGLANDLKTLSKLVYLAHKNAEDLSKLPKFKVDLDLGLKALEFFPGAVYLARPAPTGDLIEYFNNKYLIDKVSKDDLNLLKLFSPLISQIKPEKYSEIFHNSLKRFCIRSSSSLPLVTKILDLFQCDFSNFISDFTFPTLLEYLNKPEDSANASKLIKTLLAKCKDYKKFIEQLCGIRNANEAQTINLMHIVAIVPKCQYSSLLVDYVTSMSQRVKTETNRGLVAFALSKQVDMNNVPGEFLKANVTNPYFANLVYLLGLEIALNYNQNSPMMLISVLSLKLPDQLPQKIVNFLSEPGSALFSLQNLTEDESFALTRCVRLALKVYPNNQHLLKRFAKGVVSKYRKIQDYCLKNWPDVQLAALIPFIVEHLNDEVHLTSFIGVFYNLCRLICGKVKNSDDVDSFLQLIATENFMNRKRTKFLLRKCSNYIENHSEKVFKTNTLCAGLALSLPNYEQSLEKLLEELNYDKVTESQKTLSFVISVFEDPNFDEIGKFNNQCREILKSANLPIEPLDQNSVTRALNILWQQSLNRSAFILHSFINALHCRSNIKTNSDFFNTMCFKVLPIVLKLTPIVNDFSSNSSCQGLQNLSLTGACWDFIYALTSSSPNFTQISWYFTVALFKSARNQWSDKALSKLFKFVEEKISISQIENSEGFMMERVFLWVLRQSGTSLRATALTVMVDFLHAGKFSDMDEIIQEICVLIESYSSPLLNSLFQPLLDRIEPKEWKAFFDILLKLQPNTKQIVLDNLLQYSKVIPNEYWIVTPVYLCLFDETDLVSSSAADVWEKNQLQLSLEIVENHVQEYLYDENLELSLMTALALKDAISKNPDWTGSILDKAKLQFMTHKSRIGFSKLLTMICPGMSNKNLVLSTEEFILEVGMTCTDISKELLEVAILYLNTHGESLVNEFFTMIQQRTTHQNEKIRNSAVVLAGYLAKFFNTEDFRIESTIDLLLKALDMPSELLFSTVSKCLPRLVALRPQLVEALLQQEFKKLLENKPIVEKRGIGYGIACLVKGGGLKCLVSYHVLDRLESIINNKKSPDNEKAGVLIAIEGLGAVLGRSFEPYLGEVLPFIIDCFANKDLQEQAAISTKVMISRLSAHGMKRILPQLTHGLEETKWRSKVGAIEALGKMAFCAPKQLSAALPSIVPQVIKAFSDTNPKVLEAANMAISDIGSVITNPEIFQLVPVLSKALGDISHLSEAFKILIETTFHHYLDTASLSLIVPLIETGLKSRNSEYKKQACQIVGGISSLIRTPNEFAPYIERVTAAMKFSLFDSLPEVRNIAAQNLASFCEGIGSEFNESIISWLIESMEKSNLNFERSGAVHAYSEYLLYQDRWQVHLDHLLQMCKEASPIVKESYLGIFIFIPLNTQGKFEKFLSRVMPAFLERLSDDNEDVRKMVIRVVQLIIQTYCKSSLQIILPHLEQGLFDRNWRKRSSCVTLIGEMIEKIESLSRKENQQLISVEHKNRILASIYILRADHTSNINTQAAQIWKTHVDNTPKFLVSLTPELVLRLIEISDNNDAEPREIASYAIQNLIQKYQNKVFSSYINHFLTHFSAYPKGVAFVLRTVCETASRNLLITYSEKIIQILEVLLKSDDIDYLHNAGGIFHDMYQKTTIEKPDPAVMALLGKMVSYPKACRELLAFKNVGITKALLPKIMSAPERTVTLELVGKIIADDLFSVKGLENVFPGMLKECEESEDMILPVQIVVANIADPSALIQALTNMQEMISPQRQLQVVNYVCKNSSMLYTSFVDKLLDMTLSNLESNEGSVLAMIPETVKLILAPVDKEQYPDYFLVFKERLNSTEKIPLFNVPKGLEPFLPLIQNSLMYGNIEIKELAARSYCEVIELTETEILMSYAVMIVGPLIRVLSEKVPGDVKVSILDALFLLLQKTPLKLKPFVSQLQSTFTKALGHNEANVRESGSRNIIELLKLKPRLDLLFGDLGTLNNTADIVTKSLETLQKIVKATEVPSQFLSSLCNRIITELNFKTSHDVAIEAGKLLFMINMDLNTILQCLQPNMPSFILLSEILNKSSADALNIATPFIDNAVRNNFDEAVQIFRLIAEAHPKESYEMAKKHFNDMAQNIGVYVDVLCSFPEGVLYKDVESFSVIFPALARECIFDVTNEDILKSAVIKIFNVKKGDIKNVLKVLHMLDEDLQKQFRNWVQKFLG